MESPAQKFDWRLWGWWLLATAGGMSLMVALANLVAGALGAFLGAMDVGWGRTSVAIGQFLLLGAGVALPQWLVLRRHLPKAGLWIVATGIGLALGTAAGIAVLFATLISSLRGNDVLGLHGTAQPLLIGATVGAAFGLFVGSAQWLVLRRAVGPADGPPGRWSPLGSGQGAAWWLLSSLLGWAAAGCIVAYGVAIDVKLSAAAIADPSSLPFNSIALGQVVILGGLALGGVALALNTGPALVGLLKRVSERQVLVPHVLGLLVLVALWGPVVLEAPPWASTEVDLGSYYATSLQLDAAGRPHISYTDFRNDALKYATYDGAEWHVETVAAAAFRGPTPRWRSMRPAGRTSAT